MNITLWIIAAFIAVAFTAGASSQILMTKETYRSLGASQHWVDDFEPGQITTIAVIKLLGCAGLILPGALDNAPVLVPIAACCLMLVMAGAATTRFRRKEWRYLPGDLFYLGLLAFLAWGRFELHPF
ncbi:DoxX family protein [Aeromicrobium sp. CF4.19]|uniref:DoxX family protein n=1 Tax=Aeromicrobium sp. CF4.19 TaxID=3373082 RepID=UPI003EE459D7